MHMGLLCEVMFHQPSSIRLHREVGVQHWTLAKVLR